MKIIQYRSRNIGKTSSEDYCSQNMDLSIKNPWISINPNYKTINTDKAKDNADLMSKAYQDIIKIRKENPVLIYGKLKMINIENKNIFAYTRTLADKKMLVLLNISEEKIIFNVPDEINMKDSIKLLCNLEIEENDNSKITLNPYEARIYELNN
ncbi:MAG: alpha-glucosidase C-terminal domain-containing protein [bacterium]